MNARITPAATITTVDADLKLETNLVRRLQEDMEIAGLVGEKNNATVAMFCAISAKLDEPLNLTVCGESSAGKNHLLGCVAAFVPEEMKKILTGMTPKSLMHSGETEFEHKVVFIAEYEGVEKADYAIRTFQSEKTIDWEFVDTKKGLEKKSKKGQRASRISPGHHTVRLASRERNKVTLYPD